MKKIFLFVILFSVVIFAQANIPIQNLIAVYEENALHVTWTVPDTMYADKYHIFYIEAQTQYAHLIPKWLRPGMTFEECWAQEIGENMYGYFYVLPKKVFPPYTSLIRIGVMGELNGQYGLLFVAPDVLNKSLQEVQTVKLN